MTHHRPWTWALPTVGLFAALTLGGCPQTLEVSGSGLCDDGVDNDGDGLIDCADDGCYAHPSCEWPSTDDDSGDDDDSSADDDSARS